MPLDDMNLSELTLLAQEHHPEAHRGLGRKVLVAIALDGSVSLPNRQINKVRLHIMDYIVAHWTQIKPLLSCPARSGEPRACFQCSDVQAVECALTNKDLIFKGKE
jgi:hypothetical protein